MTAKELFDLWCERLDKSAQTLFALDDRDVPKEFKDGFAEGVKVSMDTFIDLLSESN